MKNGSIEFSISFLEPNGNSVQNGTVQLFCYINSNSIFSETICSPMETDRLTVRRTDGLMEKRTDKKDRKNLGNICRKSGKLKLCFL